MASKVTAAGLPAMIVALVLAVVLALVGGMATIASVSGATNCNSEGVTGTVKGVPRKLIPIYQRASVKYKLGPRGPAILAGINFVETSFGTNVATSSAGANGWMAFMPETWEAYGVDANGDGKKDPYNPWDAIFAAARYLRASGAPGDWYGAIFAYNHADWYVEKVLNASKNYAGTGTVAVSVATSCASEAAPPTDAVARMIAEADRLSNLRPFSEYVWGGSHGLTPTPPNGPFDCSSAVSHILQVGGFNNPTMNTEGLMTWGKPGPGRWVTIYNKPFEPGAHTFLEFAPGVTPPQKRYWGTSGFVEPGHGPGWIPQSTFSASYLSGFEKRHAPGI
ncbi:MAG TPA: lytic transglycosylase domain-containing protein [Solirubrobacterales bacterium]|nr:lytic transglycosylase domain-containing protein [Solirubrobacterales bacterium]